MQGQSCTRAFILLLLLLLVAAPGIRWKALTVGIVGIPALFVFRVTRLGAHFRPADLLLVRTLRTIKIPWTRVSRFLIAPRGIQPLCVVRRAGGWLEGMDRGDRTLVPFRDRVT